MPSALNPLDEDTLFFPPAASSKDACGERTCIHHQAIGTLTPLPEGQYIDEPNPKRQSLTPLRRCRWQVYPWSKTETTRDFHGVIPWGASASFETLYDHGTYYTRWRHTFGMTRLGYTAVESSRTEWPDPLKQPSGWLSSCQVAQLVSEDTYKVVARALTYRPRDPSSVIEGASNASSVDSEVIPAYGALAYGWIPSLAPAILAKPRILSALADGRSRFRAPDPSSLMSDCASRVLADTRPIDTNMWTLIPEICNVAKSVESFSSTLSRAIQKHSAKSFADLTLESEYGLRLTYSDVVESVNRLQSRYTHANGLSRARSGVSQVVRPAYAGKPSWAMSANLKCWYHSTPDNPITGALYLLYGYRALPSFEDIWDMIPFSFVADWFFNLSEVLRVVDDRTWSQVLHTESVVTSTKLMCDIPYATLSYARDPDWWGQITLSYYSRIVGNVLPVPSFSSPLGSGPFNHWVEGSALIIQALA